MSVEQSTIGAQETGRGGVRSFAASPSGETRWQRVMHVCSRLLTSLGALGGAVSLIWAAYTYSDQYTEQRRQDLLAAFTLVDGELGASTTAKIEAAISPFYEITDPEWYAVLARRNTAIAMSDNTALTAANAAMQDWIMKHLLVRDGKHDNNLHNFQDALNAIRFAFQYAKADSCNATIVGLKFRQNVYDFFYYYPGTFDLAAPQEKSVASSSPEQKITDLQWITTEMASCARQLRSLPARFVD